MIALLAAVTGGLAVFVLVGIVLVFIDEYRNGGLP